MSEGHFNDPLAGDDPFGSLFGSDDHAANENTADGETHPQAAEPAVSAGGSADKDSELPAARLLQLMEEMRREVFSLADDLRGEVSHLAERLDRVERDRLPALPAVEPQAAQPEAEAETVEVNPELAALQTQRAELAEHAQQLAETARAAADRVRSLMAERDEAVQAAEQARQLVATLPSASSLVGEADRLAEERNQALQAAQAEAAEAYEHVDAAEAELRDLDVRISALNGEEAAEPAAQETSSPAEASQENDLFADASETADVAARTEQSQATPEIDPFAEAATAVEETTEDDPFAALDSELAPVEEVAPAEDDPFADLDATGHVVPETPIEPAPVVDVVADDDPFSILGAPVADDPFASDTDVTPEASAVDAAPADDPFATLGTPVADDPFADLGAPVSAIPVEPTPVVDAAPADDPFATLGTPVAEDPFAVLDTSAAPASPAEPAPAAAPAASDPFAVLSTPAADDPFAALDTSAAPASPAEPAAPAADDPFAAQEPAAPAADDPFAALGTPVAEDPFAVLDTSAAPASPAEPAPAAAPAADDPFAAQEPAAPAAAEPAAANPFAVPEPQTEAPASDFGYVPTWEEIEDESANRAIVADIFDDDDSDVPPVPAAPAAVTQLVDSSQLPEPVDILWAAGNVDPEKNADRKQLEQVQEIREQAKVDKKGGRRRGAKAPTFEPLPWENLKPGNPLVTVVFSPSGGVGKSSNAMNLAVYMAGAAGAQAFEAEKRGTKNVRVPRILVLDGDIVHGSLALRLTGRLNPSIHELLLYMDARESQGFHGRDRWPSSYDNAPQGEREMRYFTMNHQDLPNLNLLAAPDDPDKFFDLTPNDYAEVLQLLGQFYDAIIIDSGTEIVMPSTRSWLTHAHAVLMITAPEVDRIHNARKTTRIITSHRPDPSDVSENPKPLPPLVSRDKLAVVLTKADADSGLGLAEEVLEDGFEIIDERNRFYIKDYYREMLRANNMGEFFVLQNPEYAKEIGRMAKFAFSRYTPEV